ncbi:hypothetical protein PHYC_01126 [Phycisphaerales bacterium]|nr:hypothetical protein PHYC_01126 [Phycisphaerales bacterium]
METISRRAFLGASAGLLAAPTVLASAKWRTGNPVVGSGEHTYECIHDWAKAPSNIAFGNTHGVCVTRDGRLIVKHTVHASSSSADCVCIFDPDGKFISSWGSEFRGGAHGLLLSQEGNTEYLHLADCNRGVVVKSDLDGKEVWRRTCPMESGLYNAQAEYKPTNIAIVPSNPPAGASWAALAGHLFISDGYGKNWIHHYDAKANYLGSFGGPGKERGQVACPHGIFLDTRAPEPRLVVADRSNRRLQYFSLDGRHLAFVTAEMRSPCHFDQRGQLLLVPDLEARVTLLDADDKLVVHLGDGENFGLRDKPRDQFIPGKFIAPHSACFDHDGNIFVVEWVEVGRVTKLRKVG